MENKAEMSGISLLSDSVIQNPIQEKKITSHRIVYFKSGKIVSCNCSLLKGVKKSVAVESLKNLELKGESLAIKKGTVSKIEKYLSQWIKALYYNSNEGKKKGITDYRLPVFITLTLPALQRDYDTEIKKECLGVFIEEMKRLYDVKYYFWKAEVQKSGNIHFHVVMDKFVHYRKIQDLWNQCLQRLGYITLFEAKHGHCNPPTTHVELIDSVKKAVSYVIKYVNKDLEGRNIQGRKWGCSKELRDFSVSGYLEDCDMYNYLDYLVTTDRALMFRDDYYTVYKFTKLFDYERDYTFIENLEKPDLLGLYERLYNVSKNDGSIKKSAPPTIEVVSKQLDLFGYGSDDKKRHDNHFD
jgi:hypothetical protein